MIVFLMHGLVVVEEMFEFIKNRICLRHLYVNFKKDLGEAML